MNTTNNGQVNEPAFSIISRLCFVQIIHHKNYDPCWAIFRGAGSRFDFGGGFFLGGGMLWIFWNISFQKPMHKLRKKTNIFCSYVCYSRGRGGWLKAAEDMSAKNLRRLPLSCVFFDQIYLISIILKFKTQKQKRKKKKIHLDYLTQGNYHRLIWCDFPPPQKKME